MAALGVLVQALVCASATLLTTTGPRPPLVACPGGGILFWWQAGAISALRQECKAFDTADFIGASAGSLAAVLAANGVDMDDAFDRAITLSVRANVWDRPLGLAGVWGEIVREWLDDLLPADAAERTSGRVTILLTRLLPYPKRVRVSNFASKPELIDCLMASCHIPYFLDKSTTARFAGKRWIDGSVLASSRSFRAADGAAPIVVLDPKLDANAPRDFLRLRSVDALRALVESGAEYARSEAVKPQLLRLSSALVREV